MIYIRDVAALLSLSLFFVAATYFATIFGYLV